MVQVQEEIRALIAEQGDLKAMVDRVIRDKRAIEVFLLLIIITVILSVHKMELDRLQREPHHEMERYQGEISRAQSLALAVQNERDALAAQLESLATSEANARRALEKERTQAVLTTEDAVRKAKRLETDLTIAMVQYINSIFFLLIFACRKNVIN